LKAMNTSHPSTINSKDSEEAQPLVKSQFPFIDPRKREIGRERVRKAPDGGLSHFLDLVVNESAQVFV